MLSTPADRPRVVGPVVLALVVLIALALLGRWVEIVVVILAVVAWEIWDQAGPQPRARRQIDRDGVSR